MIWESEYKITVSIAIKEEGDQETINAIHHLFENQVQRMKLVRPDAVLRVTNIKRLSDVNNERVRDRVRLFYEKKLG